MAGACLLHAAPVAACSGASVPIDEIRGEAVRIVVGTIVAQHGDAGAPDAIAIEVDAVIRGEAPTELVLQPPTFMGCDGRIAEPIGTRVVVATASQYFDASPPQDLHPYWVVRANGIAEPVGVDAGGAPGLPIEELASWLGGALTPLEASAGPSTDGMPLLGVAVAVLVVGLGVVGLVTLAVARRSPDG